MPYKVKLNVFEGPLDLLLHLIEKQEVDIYDIPITIITEQYLQYIKAMEEIDLDNVSDFLVMAATLIAIKAKMLLPQPKKENGDEEVQEEDPREALVRHLLIYKKVKLVAEALRDMEFSKRRKVSRPIEKEQYVAHLFPHLPVTGLSFQELLDALHKLLEELEPEKIHLLERKKLFVRNQMDLIMNKVRKSKVVLFKDLFIEDTGILEVIITFLALLELTRAQKIKINQEEMFGQIVISLNIRR